MTSSLPTSELVSTLQPPPAVSTDSILLVDDDAVSRTFVKAVLTRHGYSVLEASQGIEGLQVYQACLPALVILDARMPGMDGFECCRAIRQLPGGRHIPILMVTGLGDEESVNQAFEAGATDFVSKPVKMPVLVGRVRYLLEAALAERSLRQSEERYRSLVTTLQEVIFQLDIDGRLTFVNPVWTDIMGYSLEDSIGQPLERFLHPGEQARHTTQLAEVGQHPETSYRYRSRGQRQDGQMRWIEIQLCAPPPTANQAPQIAGRLRDIHERTTQEQYRRLEYAFTRILANTHNPVKAVRRVMQALCGTLEFQLGEFWQIDETRNLLTRRDAWHVNRPYVNRFADLGEYITLEDGMGIPGSAGNATAPFWVENFPHACSTMRQPMAALAKFSAALCIPISQQEKRLGMVMLVSQNPASPDQDMLRLMTILGRQLNQYWLRRQAEQQLQAQNQQFKLELQRAAEYVESLLPADSAPSDLAESVFCRTLFQPSNTLGGDVFNYMKLDEDHLVFYLLDVAGHGVKSALLSVSILNILQKRTLKGANFYQPESVLAALNNVFQVNDQGEDYFTLWYGVYHESTRQLTYATAGHPPGLLITATEDGIKTQSLCSDGIAVGLFPDFPFEAQQVVVPPHSRLYIFSDGVFEIPLDSSGKILGFEAWQALLEKHVATAATQLDQLLAAVQKVNFMPTLDDDFSILEANFMGR